MTYLSAVVQYGRKLYYALIGRKIPEDTSELAKYDCICCCNEVPFDYLVQCDDGHLFCIECFQRYVNEAPQEDSSELVNYECICCYNEVPFDYLVQCDDGHLFCIECFQRYVHEAVYGEGHRTLACLEENCTRKFSESQILRALPDSLKHQLDERIQEEILNLVNLEDFHRCPVCNFGAVDSKKDHFVCPRCSKVTCRKCRKPYDGHEEQSCVGEDDKDTKHRKELEEKLAGVLIRKCPKCKLSFTKKLGCNKVVCRCGVNICYVCRQSIAGYEHFCRHVREPGRGCLTCNRCSLFSNTDEDDRREMLEIQEAAKRMQIQEATQRRATEQDGTTPTKRACVIM